MRAFVVSSSVECTPAWRITVFLWLQLVLSLIALVHGRPEAGYSYSAPVAAAAPSAAYGAPSAGSSGAFSYASIPTQYAAPAAGINYVSSSAPAASFATSGLSSSFVNSAAPASYVSAAPASYVSGAPASYVSAAQAGGFSGASFSSAGAEASFAPSSGATLVQKHIYVHVPPPEQEEYVAPKQYNFAPPQKHYKIIFIKAPNPPTPTAPTIPVQPQNEEKTLVYVLVKKPEEAPEINIPTPAPTQPSKPEVYFIRYKTQKEAAAAAGGVGIAADAGGIADAGAVDNLDTVVVGAGRGGAASASLSSGPALASSGSAGVSSSYGPPGYKPGAL